MKVYLVNHADAKASRNPHRHLSEKGRDQADRLGARFHALGVAPMCILHSDKQRAIDTAERIAAKLGLENTTAQAAYPIYTGDRIAPFIAEIAQSSGDIMMCGHTDYLLRAASQLVCGDETRKVVEFKPGNGTAVCLEGGGNSWVITCVWRQDHPPG